METGFQGVRKLLLKALILIFLFINLLCNFNLFGLDDFDRMISGLKNEKEIAKKEKIYFELGETKDKRAIDVLSNAALNDKEPGLRINAIFALRKIGGDKALKTIIKVIDTEKHKGVRIQAINSLGFFNEPEALLKLRDISRNDPDKDIRISAVMALSRLNDKEGLISNFDVEKDSSVKLGIIDALSRVDGGEEEIKKIKVKNKDAKISERIDFYTGEKVKKK